MALHSDDIYYGSYPTIQTPKKEFKPYMDYNYYIKKTLDGILLQNPGELSFTSDSALIRVTFDSDLKIITFKYHDKFIDTNLLPPYHIELDNGEKDLFKRNQINFKIIKIVFKEPIDSLLA